MEVTLYGSQEYPSYRLPRNMDDVRQLKKRLTLDLDSRPAKRQRSNHVLTSPDLKMLKLASPELERLIIQNSGLVKTPTPGGPQAVSSVFARVGTEEQEQYARGFVDALQRLRQQEQQGGAAAAAAASAAAEDPESPVYTTLESSSGAAPPSTTCSESLPGGSGTSSSIKEEPEPPPSCSSSSQSLSPSPQPHSPLNMADQERIKLERKRLRNRIAATKCRKRKLERIARLEERVRQIQQDNRELALVAGRLREQVAELKREVLDHTQNGCQIMYSSPGPGPC